MLAIGFRSPKLKAGAQGSGIVWVLCSMAQMAAAQPPVDPKTQLTLPCIYSSKYDYEGHLYIMHKKLHVIYSYIYTVYICVYN